MESANIPSLWRGTIFIYSLSPQTHKKRREQILRVIERKTNTEDIQHLCVTFKLPTNSKFSVIIIS